MLFPILIGAFTPDKISSPTFNLFGAIIYLLSPSLYNTSMICADLFGSYSNLSILPGTSYLFLLKSITLYFCLCPPPTCLVVILPVLFLPPVFLRAVVRCFSGLCFVTSEKSLRDAKRLPGEVGFKFQTKVQARRLWQYTAYNKYTLVGFRTFGGSDKCRNGKQLQKRQDRTDATRAPRVVRASHR